MFWNTHIVFVCVTAIVLSMGTKLVNKEEIVNGTRSEDSVNLRLSSLRVFTMIMYSNLCFNVFVFFIYKKVIFIALYYSIHSIQFH